MGKWESSLNLQWKNRKFAFQNQRCPPDLRDAKQITMKKIFLLFALAGLIVPMSCAKHTPSTESGASSNASQAVLSAEVKAESVVRTISEDIHGADILPAIARNYEGKVVLFDFWATWCGPCRQAMKLIDEIKPELLQKGCVFVYVTGETSPSDMWERMIAEIDGDHYRLTDTQWTELCRALNIPGIPAYLLLGKDGEKAYDNLSEGGYPGSEILKNNIEVALSK